MELAASAQVEATAASQYGHCVQAQSSSTSTTAKYSWLIAVAFCVGGAIVSNFGVNLQKMAHMQKKAGSAAPSKYRALWIMGACCARADACSAVQHPHR